MRNFLKIAENIDVIPILHAINRQPELWNENKLRTTHPDTPHSQVEDIWLRFNDLTPYLESQDYSNIIDEHESIFYPAWHKIPQAHALVHDLMRKVEGIRLGRVLITRLAPGKNITPHVDSGAHAAY